MKKFISMALAAVMSLSMAVAVHAEDHPKVYINGTLISFADQEPVILGEGTTLVPARGVFEAMGANVGWDGEQRLVSIDTSNNITRVRLTIDDPVMKVYTFNNILAPDLTEVALAVAPQIINDRTMIPLRAISEAIGADVKWDGDAYSVIITTADNDSSYTPPADPDIPSGNGVKTAMSISSSVDSVSEGDTVDIYVNIANMPAEAYLSGLSALVSYSKEDFEFDSCSFYRDGNDIEVSNDNIDAPAGIVVKNPNYYNGVVKAAMITLDNTMTTSGNVARLTFKALTSNGGDFALVKSYDTVRGYDNIFTFTKSDNITIFEVSGSDLYLDLTPITVSGK